MMVGTVFQVAADPVPLPSAGERGAGRTLAAARLKPDAKPAETKPAVQVDLSDRARFISDASTSAGPTVPAAKQSQATTLNRLFSVRNFAATLAAQAAHKAAAVADADRAAHSTCIAQDGKIADLKSADLAVAQAQIEAPAPVPMPLYV